jgi:hypothetical protein
MFKTLAEIGWQNLVSHAKPQKTKLIAKCKTSMLRN